MQKCSMKYDLLIHVLLEITRKQFNTAKTLTVSKMLFLLMIIQYPIDIVSYGHSGFFILL